MNALNDGPICVLGSGAWGTALAATLRQAGNEVRLWGRDEALAAEINEQQTNDRYLPDIRLPHGIDATVDRVAALEGSRIVLSVVPAQVTGTILAECRPHLPANVPVVLCAKGIDRESGKLLSQIAEDAVPEHPIAALSGPSFATDVARGLPTAVTVATGADAAALDLAEALSTPTLRCYGSDDLIGVEVGGALKNVLALAAGAVTGAGLGSSAQAALITRGFVELRRLGVALGGEEITMMGLSGLGDLLLTCSSTQSRNYSYGIALGAGEPLEGRKLAEGVFSARIAQSLAREHDLPVPIIDAVVGLLERNVTPQEALAELMNRPLKHEGE